MAKGLAGRPRLVFMLAPAVLGVGGLFVVGLVLGALRTIGVAPFAGRYDLTLEPWRRALAEPGLAASLTVTVAIAIVVTLLSTALGTLLALVLDRSIRRSGGGAARRLMETALAVPHVVAAIGMAALFAQSGLLARVAHAAGLIDAPSGFPALVQDPHGFGIGLAYLWKEVPFVAVVVLSVLVTRDGKAEAIARTLGASRAQAFRWVTLPAILPASGAAAALVFAYVLGAYEIPAVMSASHPKPVPLLAVDLFTSGDVADRPAAIALSLGLAAVGLVMLAAWRRLARFAPPVPPA
jgi:putative spermidine/putrescine transport system permease protein